MTRRLRALLVLSTTIAACASSSARAPTERASSASLDGARAALACVDGAAPAGSPAARLDWLIGTWIASDDDTETTERWCMGEGGALVGESRARQGDRELESEAMRIEARGDALVYVASPSGQARTEFTGDVHCGSDVLAGNCDRSCEASFANPTHDFPTELVYGSCVGSGFLVATIRGGERRASWTFHRAPE